jgi:hypothetical protein
VVTEAKGAIAKTGGIQDRELAFQGRMQQDVEWFRYREIVPQLHEIFISALPNAENNPEQKDLYEAFAQGNVTKVKQIPRPERKQLFLTTISIFYTDDLDKAQFRQSAKMRRDALMQESQMEETDAYMNDEMRMQMESAYGAAAYAQLMGITSQQQKAAGFVVTIEGYSPYRNIGALLDPPNVRDNRSRWGFVTRIENLKEFQHLDVNSPFTIYPPMKDAPHYKLETGVADPDGDIPKGVGEWQFIPDPLPPGSTATGAMYQMSLAQRPGTWILVDPMTKELISAEPVKDQYGNLAYDATGKPVKDVHDHWFRLQFKLKWADAPKSAAPAGGAMTGARR